MVAVALFIAALAVTLAAAATFARRLDRLGAKYGLPEVWIGLLTALAADGPEVSSALVALIKGAHDASVGVIVGSNTFNLAAMIGVSALLVGCVQVARNTLLLEGSVALAVTVIVIALLVGWISAVPAVLAIACVVGVYLLLVLGGEQLADRLGLSRLAALVKDRDSRWALVTYGWPERRDVVIAGGHVVGQEAVALCSSEGLARTAGAASALVALGATLACTGTRERSPTSRVPRPPRTR